MKKSKRPHRRTVSIDANDIAGSFGAASRFFTELSGTPIEIRNLDAFFDVATEYCNGLRIVVSNAGNLTPDARRMLDGALANSTGLKIDFRRGDGGVEHRKGAAPDRPK